MAEWVEGNMTGRRRLVGGEQHFEEDVTEVELGTVVRRFSIEYTTKSSRKTKETRIDIHPEFITF